MQAIAPSSMRARGCAIDSVQTKRSVVKYASEPAGLSLVLAASIVPLLVIAVVAVATLLT